MTNEKDSSQPTHEIIPIPEIFYNTDTKSPFCNCTMCDTDILSGDTPYVIEKAIKNYPEENTQDVIFEYALCMECLDVTRKSFSKDSLIKINEYMTRNINMEERRKNLSGKNTNDIYNWISNCIVNNKSVDELPEYQIMCQCYGENMLIADLPYMISCDVTEEIQELLSQQTKDELNRFYDNNLGIPPELRELFKTKTPIF